MCNAQQVSYLYSSIYVELILLLTSMYATDMLPCAWTCPWNLDTYPSSCMYHQTASIELSFFSADSYVLISSSVTDEGLHCHSKA